MVDDGATWDRPDAQFSSDSMIAEEMARAMQRAVALTLTPQASSESEAVAQNGRAHAPPNSQSSKIIQLPQELILQIFQFTREAAHQYDPSIIQGPDSLWMRGLRTRKALTLVCKAFVGPASAVLYEDIVLRRMGQIPALARTLDPQRTPSAHAFSQLVRSIRIDSCVVWAPFADVVEEELRMIFFRCTALKAFSFAVHWNESACWSLHTDTANVMNWLLASDPKQCQLRLPLTRGLLELELALDRTQGRSLISCLHTSLEHAHQLIKLKLQTTVDESVPWWDDPIKRPLRLSSLQELILHLTGHCTEVLDYIREAWSLPKLVALTVASEGRAQPAPFLRAHGANLTYLHWYDVNLKSDAALNELLAFCPRLEHLVIRLPCHPACPQLHCPTLRFLDFWETPDKEVPTRCRIPVSSVGAGTPRLERIRTLRRPCTPLFWRHAGPEGAQAIVDPTVIDWPRIFPPTAVEDNEHQIWRFPLWYVVQASWTLFTDQHIDPWEGNWAEIHGPPAPSDLDSLDHHPSLDDNIEDDPTYVHSEGTDEDSEPSLEDVDEDEIDKDPVIPLDRETFLDMFHASQSPPALLDEIDPE